MNDCFLRACHRQPTEWTPVWLMRQAGRYLPEYRALRARYSLLDLCREPALAAEVTLLPVRRFGVDAAILFSDLVIPLQAMGVTVTVQENYGPVVADPVRRAADVERLRPLEPETDLAPMLATIRALRRDLTVPLIGFAGAPFTLACYLVEGGPSRDFARVRALLYQEAATWRALMERLTENIIRVAVAQVQAGAQAFQVFDSWAGALSPTAYREAVLPYLQRLCAALRPLGVPVIYFATGAAALLDLLPETGATVIGLDWRVPLDQAWERLGDGVAVQGNLDPAVLLAPFPEVARQAADVLARAGGRPGHIFNLGHGVLPETPPETVAQLVAFVHQTSARVARPVCVSAGETPCA